MGKISQCEARADEILALNAEGLTRKEIAEKVGLRFHVVQAWLQRRKVPGLPRSERLLELSPDDLRQMLETGATHTKIAEHFGVSISCVERSCARFGLKPARTGPRAGRDHPRWKEGRALDKHGYVRIYAPLHPHAAHSGYVFEHRLVMEVVTGRYLEPTEAVDHVDDHPRHNWPDNLKLYASNADHLRATLAGREKATPRRSIPGAYGSTQKIPHCPGTRDTLALCPSEILAKIERHISIHQPATEHQSLPRRSFLRNGALQAPFA